MKAKLSFSNGWVYFNPPDLNYCDSEYYFVLWFWGEGDEIFRVLVKNKGIECEFAYLLYTIFVEKVDFNKKRIKYSLLKGELI